MGARLTALLPRLAVIVVVLLLATTAVTFAAQGPAPVAAPAAAPTPTAPQELVVPDVTRQAYVFAKGILEEGGFAWQVRGSVQGFAANQVVSQTPAPGTRVVDNGAPLVTLTLARNSAYKQEGTPENASPYAATPLVLAGAAAAKKPKSAKPAAAPKTAPKPKTPVAEKKAKPSAATEKRTAAFTVPGAPPEPLDEMPLPDRVRQLDAWLTRHPKASPANVDHWLFQHSWVVTGARFGWWRGAEALRLLIRVDERVQKLWGVGSDSEAVARKALAEVEARAA